MLTEARQAQEKKPAEKPGVVMVDGASITATVETIDYDKRTIALKGPRGNVVALKVGSDEKNFQQIKTGDRVTAKYYESSSSCASPMSLLLRSEGPLLKWPLPDNTWCYRGRCC